MADNESIDEVTESPRVTSIITVLTLLVNGPVRRPSLALSSYS